MLAGAVEHAFLVGAEAGRQRRERIGLGRQRRGPRRHRGQPAQHHGVAAQSVAETAQDSGPVLVADAGVIDKVDQPEDVLLVRPLRSGEWPGTAALVRSLSAGGSLGSLWEDGGGVPEGYPVAVRLQP